MALAGTLALALAWWTEHALGHVPCGLCLWERWPYRVLVGLGIGAMVLPRDAARPVLWCCMPVLLASCGLSVLHVGVEQGWWPSPLPECRAPTFHGGTFAERLAAMPVRPAKPCDAPTYLVAWLPVSMTALSGLYAFMLLLLVPRGLKVKGRFRGRGRKTIQ
ncbi:disulfide bond formation protein B [Novacetimonas maltaceti]|uniref:Disulfide bond formation protein B n=1 Tax=Novacetimonas maltaceti TaxID=1203393 RepID=A0A2S3W0T3_9PROT|nr:disulfide bond formation protein B [Novacetimonas maltaceti]POF62456.1 hypothetical protein KMAL_19430 [Novacetimonas maltaceti]PYD60648.1 disulfide bond formation protein B [Novacetimonas maltaceti]